MYVAAYCFVVLASFQIISLHGRSDDADKQNLEGESSHSLQSDSGQQDETHTGPNQITPSVNGGPTVGKYEAVKNQVSTAAGKLKGGLMKSVNGLTQSVEDLRQKAYVNAGNIYENTNSVRLYWGKAWNVMSDKRIYTSSSTERLDLLVTALTTQMVEAMPESTSIDPIEIRSKSKYICGAKGEMSNLKTIKHLHTETENTNNGVKMFITYSFGDLHFSYKSFYVNMVKIMRLRGTLNLKYSNNRVTLIIALPKTVELIRNIVLKNCIMRINDFKVNEFEFDKSELDANSKKRRKMTESAVNKYARENGEQLKNNFGLQVLVELHRAFAASGDWICKDSNLRNLVKEKGGSLEDVVMSDKFRQKCLGEKVKRKKIG